MSSSVCLPFLLASLPPHSPIPTFRPRYIIPSLSPSPPTPVATPSPPLLPHPRNNPELNIKTDLVTGREGSPRTRPSLAGILRPLPKEFHLACSSPSLFLLQFALLIACLSSFFVAFPPQFTTTNLSLPLLPLLHIPLFSLPSLPLSSFLSPIAIPPSLFPPYPSSPFASSATGQGTTRNYFLSSLSASPFEDFRLRSHPSHLHKPSSRNPL